MLRSTEVQARTNLLHKISCLLSLSDAVIRLALVCANVERRCTNFTAALDCQTAALLMTRRSCVPLLLQPVALSHEIIATSTTVVVFSKPLSYLVS